MATKDQRLNVRVVQLPRYVPPARDTDRIMREALRMVDARQPSPRSWLQRLGDRMEASELVEAVVCTVVAAGCLGMVLGGLWLLQQEGWLW